MSKEPDEADLFEDLIEDLPHHPVRGEASDDLASVPPLGPVVAEPTNVRRSWWLAPLAGLVAPFLLLALLAILPEEFRGTLMMSVLALMFWIPAMIGRSRPELVWVARDDLIDEVAYHSRRARIWSVLVVTFPTLMLWSALMFMAHETFAMSSYAVFFALTGLAIWQYGNAISHKHNAKSRTDRARVRVADTDAAEHEHAAEENESTSRADSAEPE